MPKPAKVKVFPTFSRPKVVHFHTLLAFLQITQTNKIKLIQSENRMVSCCSGEISTLKCTALKHSTHFGCLEEKIFVQLVCSDNKTRARQAMNLYLFILKETRTLQSEHFIDSRPIHALF